MLTGQFSIHGVLKAALYNMDSSMFVSRSFYVLVPDRLSVLCVSGGGFSVTLFAGYIDSPVGDDSRILLSESLNYSFSRFVQ